MILDGLFNAKNNVILKKTMQFASENQRVILNNIANVETPGFTAKKLHFKDSFKEAIRSGDVERISQIETVVKDNRLHPYRMDRNNVSIEAELSALDENKNIYEMTASLLKKRLGFWKTLFEKIKE